MIKFEQHANVNKALAFMEAREIPLIDNVYRPLSESYFEFFREARQAYKDGTLKVSTLDAQILDTDLGEMADYEGEEVPLDCPLVEDVIDEKMYYAIATKSSKAKTGWRRVPDTRFDTKQSAERYGDKYHTDRYGAKMYKVVTFNEETEGEKVELGKPKRGGPKKFYVYVKNPATGNIKKVAFGDTGGSSKGTTLRTKINDPVARKAFATRHKCDTRDDKTKPSYWSCRLPRYAKMLGLQVDNPSAWW